MCTLSNMFHTIMSSFGYCNVHVVIVMYMWFQKQLILFENGVYKLYMKA
jgi:hypothetical protein